MAVETRPIDAPPAEGPAEPEVVPGPRHAPPFVGQVVSGVALIVLLGLHMIAQHFVVPSGLRFFDDVVEWLSNPIVIVLEVAFLLFVTYHALIGVRAIIFDFGFSRRTQGLITNILWVIGIITVIYGIVLFAAIINAG
jgi:succinate dehydrogenase / fumarate reductase membrane anchor subunit